MKEILDIEVERIKERNRRVEAEKAWEGSALRVTSICFITYIIAATIMYVIGVERYLVNSLIPVIGYFLSTLSLPIIKRRWITNYQKSHERLS